MVDVQLRKEEGLDITGYPGKDTIFDRFEEIFIEYANKVESEMGIDGLWLFGSFARGTAIKGESDLDLVVSMKNMEGDELSPRFDMDRGKVAGWVREKSGRIIEGYEEWFSSKPDTTHTIPVNKWIDLLEKTFERREERPLGEPQVWDVISERFVSREELKDLAPEEALRRVGKL